MKAGQTIPNFSHSVQVQGIMQFGTLDGISFRSFEQVRNQGREYWSHDGITNASMVT